MPRYIDADEFQKAIEEKAKRLKNLDTINGLCGAIPILYEQPTADVQPVIHAKWLNKFHRTPRGIILPDIECDNCHNCTDKKYKYCPNCGAKMDKESKDGSNNN